MRALGAVTDHWPLSGIVSSTSGAPFSPTCGLTSGAPSVTGGYTGTPDVSARCQVIGDPLATPDQRLRPVFYNPAAFALPGIATGPDNTMVGPPVLGDLGGGAGVLPLPHITNFDATIANVPLGSEKRILRFQLQAYNVFNHTEINALGTAIHVRSGYQPGVQRFVDGICHRDFTRPRAGVHRPDRVLAVLAAVSKGGPMRG